MGSFSRWAGQADDGRNVWFKIFFALYLERFVASEQFYVHTRMPHGKALTKRYQNLNEFAVVA